MQDVNMRDTSVKKNFQLHLKFLTVHFISTLPEKVTIEELR